MHIRSGNFFSFIPFTSVWVPVKIGSERPAGFFRLLFIRCGGSSSGKPLLGPDIDFPAGQPAARRALWPLLPIASES